MSRKRSIIVPFLLLTAVLLAVPVTAAPVASRSEAAADLQANDELVRVLEAHGLSPEEVEQRLAQLSDEDLEYLRANLDQVQSAGEVPDYIWILLAVLLGVVILGAIF